MEIPLNSQAYTDYFKMTQNPDTNHKIIGNGEASCLALAKQNKGIIASNNLRDISEYLKEYKVKHLSTADIMIEAYKLNYITEKDGNDIW